MIDPISQEITELSKVSALQKRMATEWLLFLMAIGMIFGWFSLMTYMLSYVEREKANMQSYAYTAYV